MVLLQSVAANTAAPEGYVKLYERRAKVKKECCHKNQPLKQLGRAQIVLMETQFGRCYCPSR